MGRKNFSEIAELEDSEAVFNQLANPEQEAKPKPAKAAKPRQEPHTRATIWLPSAIVEDMAALAFGMRTRASYLVEQALREYLDEPTRKKIVKRYRREGKE